MNRFRSRKKSTGAATPRRTSDDSEVPSLPLFSSKSFKKSKKAQPEVKPEVDLSNALPSSDDFRTSLLMPNLSARFSMLREQDDPTSKLGKANDDSVLHPKRKSRLGDFGFQPGRGPLTDIAEIRSIHAPIRPPFASVRTGSYASGDGYSTDDDSHSIISRSRPGEGNNLFGGRQKIYKIPVGGSSSSKLGDESGNQGQGRGMGGKALYGDDVSISAFQKLRERERENERLAELSRQHDLDVPSSDHTTSSPPSTYNQNRDTTSSTTSAPSNARISTAATSIASQGANSVPVANAPPPIVTTAVPTAHAVPSIASTVPERSLNKSRRLYEQGLDQYLFDQQSSAVSRLEFLQRQRVPGGGVYAPHSSRNDNVPNAHDRHYRQGPPPAPVANGFRAASPPPPASADVALSKFDLGIGESKTAGSYNPQTHNHTRPLSPTFYNPMRSMSPTGEEEDSFAAAVEPRDRGKATALGTFNKPSRQYDERQYSQRQKQMQRGRDTPTPPPGRVSPPRATRAPAQDFVGAPNEPNASSRSRSASASGRNYFYQPQSQEPLPNGKSPIKTYSPNPPQPIQPDPHETFLAPATPEGADSPVNGFIQDDRQESNAEKPRFRRPADIMAAMQNIHQPSQPPGASSNRQPDIRLPPTDLNNVHGIYDPTTSTSLAAKEDSMSGQMLNGVDNDSPTLGPNGGLHGLVSAHLRSDSGQSSIYTAPSPLVTNFSHARQKSSSSLAKPSISTRPGHEFDDWDGGHYQDSHGYRPASPIAPPKPDFSVPNGVSSKAMKVLGEQPNRTSHESSHGGGLSGDNNPIEVPSKAMKVLGEPLNTSGHGASKSGQQPEIRKLNGVSTKAMKVLGEDSQELARASQESSRSTRLPEESRGRHAKNASTETQREKEDFANELAHRRKMVQENLKSFVESESRSTSPAPSSRREYPKEHYIKTPGAFGILKPKTSRGSLASRHEKQEAPSKAMKMLGITGPNSKVDSAHPQRSEDDRRRQQDERMLRGFRGHPVNAPPMNKPLQQTRHDMQRDHKQRQRGNSDENSDSSSNKEPSPQSSRSSVRDRSSSDVSGGRSKSRNGRYRDDLQKAMAEGAGSSANYGYPDMPREMPRTQKYSNSPVPSPEVHQQAWQGHSSPALSARLRSNSKSGYFDGTSNSLSPVQTNSSAQIGAPRPSPVTPHSAHSTPSVSTVTTPTTGVAPQPCHPNNRIPTHRKRSVNKYDISEPIFVSGTSNITTVNLAPGASLSNGIQSPPPVPAFSPRRKRTTTTQAFFNHFGKADKAEQPGMPTALMPSPQEELSTFSADEGETRPRHRHKLRKSSSEGGNLNAKARQQAMNAPSPAMPDFPSSLAPSKSSPPRTFDGAMF